MLKLCRFFVGLALVGVAGCGQGGSAGDSREGDLAGGGGGGGTINSAFKPLHRLDQVEYANSVADLTGITTDYSYLFPDDETYNNFDNVADVLSVTTFASASIRAGAQIGAQVTAAATDANLKQTVYLNIAPCANDTKTSAANCLLQTAQTFGMRAWRRPLTTDEVTKLVSSAQAQGSDLPTQIGNLVEALVVSPYFLFRIEHDPVPGSDTLHPVTSFELASRLSYFLWRTTPDDQLLASANSNALLKDTELSHQVTRMMADPRAKTLVSGFANRWLFLNQLAFSSPDPNVFTGYNAKLQASMAAETSAYLNDFILGDGTIGELVTAPYTYADNSLATWYGIASPSSQTVVKVDLPAASGRQGILTQGSILVVGSNGVNESPVKRGHLIIGQLLCQSPADPPSGIPALTDDANKQMTTRQSMAQHLTDPACSGCHVQMDDLGFAFENFDGAGKLRTTDNGLPVDTTGTYMKLTPFSNSAGMAQALSTDERYARCVAENLYIYALGRQLTIDESTIVDELQKSVGGTSGRIKDLIKTIALSPGMRYRRGKNTK